MNAKHVYTYLQILMVESEEPCHEYQYTYTVSFDQYWSWVKLISSSQDYKYACIISF